MRKGIVWAVKTLVLKKDLGSDKPVRLARCAKQFWGGIFKIDISFTKDVVTWSPFKDYI